MFGHLTVILGLLLLLGAALHDIAVRTVPNCIPATLVVLGLTARLQDGELLASIAVGAAVLLAVGLLCLRGVMGGGDAKLLAAVALLAPPGIVLNLLLMTALCGGVLAMFYLAMSYLVTRPSVGRRRSILARVAKAECWRLSRRGPLPYAVAIAGGSLISLSPLVAG